MSTESSVLSPRGEESSVLFPRGEDGHQVTRTGNLWRYGGTAEQSKNEEIEYAESVKEAAPPMTPTQKPDVEVPTDAIRKQAFPIQASVAQQHRIQEDTTSGKGRPKSGDGGATRSPEGRSEGKGGKSRQWRNPSGFASHASEEMFIEMDDSRLAMPCGYTVDENSLTICPNTHGGDNPSDDYADVYNTQDGNECEDSHEGYDTSGDWNGKVVATNDAEERNSIKDICRSIVEDIIEACELENVANNATQDPELCPESIQDYTASMVKSRRGKGKGNASRQMLDPVTNERRKKLAELRDKTPCNYCGQKGHWRPQCSLSSEASDSSEDIVKCSYMVVKVDEDPASNNQEELRYDCEPLSTRMKYEQMTHICVFLRRWLQVTAGSKMLEQMSKVTGGIDDTQMETAIMKAIRLTRGLYKPEPVPSMPIGNRNTSMKFIMKIPEFLWRWYQLMEGNRPYRRARQERDLAENAEEKWKKLGYNCQMNEVTDLAKEEENARQFKTLSGPDRVRVQVYAPRPAQLPYPTGIGSIHTGRDADEVSLRVATQLGTNYQSNNDTWAIIDTGCNTNVMPRKWMEHAKARFAASQENIDKDSDEDINGPIPPHAGGGLSSSSCHWMDVDSMKPETPSPDSDEDTSSAEASEAQANVSVPASIAATAAAMEQSIEADTYTHLTLPTKA